MRTVQGNQSFLQEEVFSANGTVFFHEFLGALELAQSLHEIRVSRSGGAQILVITTQGFQEVANQLNSLNSGPSEGIGEYFHQDVLHEHTVEVELQLLLHGDVPIVFLPEKMASIGPEGGNRGGVAGGEIRPLIHFFNKFTAAMFADQRGGVFELCLRERNK